MSRTRYLPAALASLDEIYAYTMEQFGPDQTDRYLSRLFAACESVTDRPTRKLPAALGVSGSYSAYGRHFIYWRMAKDGDVIIAAILHQSQNLPVKLAEAEREND